MKKLLFFATFISLLSFSSRAQDYSTGIGLRGGFASGLTIKHFVGSQSAIEGIISTRWHGLYIVGLYEQHAQAFGAPGLYWFYGGGAHIGSWNNFNHGHPHFIDNHTGSYFAFGLNGVVGIEYDIQSIPISIGVDLIPNLTLIQDVGLWIGSGLSVRYLIR